MSSDTARPAGKGLVWFHATSANGGAMAILPALTLDERERNDVLSKVMFTSSVYYAQYILAGDRIDLAVMGEAATGFPGIDGGILRDPVLYRPDELLVLLYPVLPCRCRGHQLRPLFDSRHRLGGHRPAHVVLSHEKALCGHREIERANR